MSTLAPAPTLLATTLRLAEADAGARTRRVLALTLALSLALHFALTLYDVAAPGSPEPTLLTATITELPPPPKPEAVAPPAPQPKPRRTSPVARPAPVPAPVEVPAEPAAPEIAQAPPVPEAVPEPPASAPVAEAEVIPGAVVQGKTLPPRIDLAYKVFWGTRGFMIGDAVYRFEHRDQRYRISTIGEARGLAALVLRGQGKVESRGLITGDGLQPQVMRVERGGPDRVETAVFDWEAGIVTMHGDRTAPLDLPTFDPLALMWQYYFTPPTSDEVSVTVATPRRVFRYTLTREATETIEWPHGPIEAERWHRRSLDGKTDAYVWLAPSLRHIPVKMRVSNTDRGTVEVLLDSIRVDEDPAAVGRDELAMPRIVEPPAPQDEGPLAQPRPAETFPTMTGQ